MPLGATRGFACAWDWRGCFRLCASGWVAPCSPPLRSGIRGSAAPSGSARAATRALLGTSTTSCLSARPLGPPVSLLRSRKGARRAHGRPKWPDTQTGRDTRPQERSGRSTSRPARRGRPLIPLHDGGERGAPQKFSGRTGQEAKPVVRIPQVLYPPAAGEGGARVGRPRPQVPVEAVQQEVDKGWAEQTA